MTRPLVCALVLAAPLALLPGTAGGASGGSSHGAGSRASAAGVRIVELRKISFTPATLRIRRGTRVRWIWRDGPATPHDVTSRGHRRFRSAPARTTGSYTFRFTRAGTYSYVCTIHPGMRGKVVVR